MEEYTSDECICPNCGATLNNQYGFDPDNGSWTCTECDQLLYGDDVYDGDIYPGIMWYCDGCDELLNIQYEFADYYSTWTCTSCGHTNNISEDEIHESEEDYQSHKSTFNRDSYDDNDDDDENEEDDEGESESYQPKWNQSRGQNTVKQNKAPFQQRSLGTLINISMIVGGIFLIHLALSNLLATSFGLTMFELFSEY